MPLLDALAGILPALLGGLAVALGVASKVLAARLLLSLDRAANDPVFRRSYRTRIRREERRPYAVS